MARLTASERDALPPRAFVFPKERKYPLFALVGGKLVPSARRAKSAIGFANMLQKKGKLSKAKAGKVRAAAKRVLKKCDDTGKKGRKKKPARCVNPKKKAPAKKKAARKNNPSTSRPKFKRHQGRSWRPPKWSILPELGRVVDLEVAHPDGVDYFEKYKGGQRPLMLWDKRSKTLLWVYTPRTKLPALRAGAPRDGGHAATYERWMDDGSEATRHRAGYKVPSPTDVFRRAGRALTIGYDSDKFGEANGRRYEHKFTSDVSVYVLDLGSRGHAIALRGGSLRVTKHGIEG